MEIEVRSTVGAEEQDPPTEKAAVTNGNGAGLNGAHAGEDDAPDLGARLAAIVEAAKDRAGAAFTREAIALHIQVRVEDPGLWMDHRAALKKANPAVNLLELDRLTKPAPAKKVAASGSAIEVVNGDAPFALDDDGSGCPYRYAGDRLVYTYKTKEGEAAQTTLTNFRARIVTDIVEDDGAVDGDQAPDRFFELVCEQHGRMDRVRVPAQDFGGMEWVIRYLGATHIVYPGAGRKDRARAAIQTLSAPEKRTIYTHTGWRQIGGKWVFLHADGAIGTVGTVSGIEVKLPRGLRRYSLPPPPSGGELREAVRRSLGFLSIAAPGQTWPVYATALAAPLGEVIQMDFMNWTEGPSGARKTTAKVLLMNHYGDFSEERHLPCGFGDTANSIEMTLYAGKNVLLEINDFAPQEDPRAAGTQDQLAIRLARSVGNNQGRNRLTRDCRQMGERPPRGLPGVSSELPFPGSQSGEARVFNVRWESVDLEQLTRAQDQDRPYYALAMSGFLQWLAGRMDELKSALPAQVREEARRIASDGIAHGRLASTGAKLILSVRTFLQFAQEAGAVTEEMCAAHADAARSAILSCIEGTDERAAEKCPDALFFDYVRAALLRGSAFVRDFDTGEAPGDDWRRYGWEEASQEYGTKRPRPGAVEIGWLKDGELHLVPQTAYKLAAEAARAVGKSFPANSTGALAAALDRAGKLQKTGGEEQRGDGKTQRRLTWKATVPGVGRVPVWVVNVPDVFPQHDDEELPVTGRTKEAPPEPCPADDNVIFDDAEPAANGNGSYANGNGHTQEIAGGLPRYKTRPPRGPIPTDARPDDVCGDCYRSAWRIDGPDRVCQSCSPVSVSAKGATNA